VPGVTKVNNNLIVGNPQQAQEALNAVEPQPDQSDPGQPQDSPRPSADGEWSGRPAGQRTSAAAPGLSAADASAISGPGPISAAGQYPQQGQYPPPYPPARPQYGPYGSRQQGYNQQPQAPAYTPATGPVTVAQGTLLQVRTNEPVASKKAADGTPVQFTVISDVAMGGVLAIPRGAVVHGVVTEVKNVGRGDLGGSSSLALTLTSLDLGGQNYPLTSDQFKVKGPNKAGKRLAAR